MCPDIMEYSIIPENWKKSGCYTNILKGQVGQSGNYMPDSLTLTQGKIIEWLIQGFTTQNLK